MSDSIQTAADVGPDEIIWPTDVDAALKDQLALRSALVTADFDLGSVKYALAIGVSYSNQTQSAVCVGVPCYSDCTPVSESHFLAEEHVAFPYVPGLFAYREGPAISRLLSSLDYQPDLLFFDAQGIAHPRGFGLACHLGVLHGIPALGATRKRLFGRSLGCGQGDGAVAELVDKQGETIGYEFRPLTNCSSFFASHGHLTSNATLLSWLQSIGQYRGCFPVALERAHNLANRRAFKR